MSQDSLSLVLHALDAASNARFQYGEVSRWPEGQLDALVGAGILRQAELADIVVCDGCEEACREDVELITEDDGPPRAYVICHDVRDLGRVQVDLRRLATWTVSAQGVAEWLAGQLCGSSAVEECTPGRLWWLGRTGPQDERDAFLAVGTTRPDAPAVFSGCIGLQDAEGPLVFVPSVAPSPFPHGRRSRVVPLVGAVSHGEDGLHLEPPRPPLSAAEATDDGRQVVLVIDGGFVQYRGVPVELPPLPLKLLTALAYAKGKPVEKDRLAQAMYGKDSLQYLDVVKQHVGRANQVFREVDETAAELPGSDDQDLIRWHRSGGYRLNLRSWEVTVISTPAPAADGQA